MLSYYNFMLQEAKAVRGNLSFLHSTALNHIDVFQHAQLCLDIAAQLTLLAHVLPLLLPLRAVFIHPCCCVP
jgi:hypothetical protein